MLAVLAVPLLASAQFQTPIRYNEGPGIKLTDSLVFHPGLAIEGRVDSNVLQTDSERKAAPYMRLIGHFDLATRGMQRLEDGAPQRIQFAFKTALSYREYFAGEDVLVDQRALEADAGMNFRWSPSRHFNLALSDTFSRQVQVRNFPVTASSALPNTTLALDQNQARLGLELIPGGGRLSITTGYALNLYAFEDAGFGGNNKLFHEASVGGRFKILPMTAVLVEASWQFTNYLQDASVNVDSMPLRVQAGVIGLLTSKLNILAKIGYGNTFHDSGESASTVLATAELGYAIGPTGKFKLGYQHTMMDSVFANYATDHRVYGGYDQLIASRFILHLAADYAYRSFGGFERVQGVAGATLDQHLMTGGLALDWQIQEWVYVGVGYDVQLQSNAISNLSDVLGATDFVRHQGYAKVGISY